MQQWGALLADLSRIGFGSWWGCTSLMPKHNLTASRYSCAGEKPLLKASQLSRCPRFNGTSRSLGIQNISSYGIIVCGLEYVQVTQQLTRLKCKRQCNCVFDSFTRTLCITFSAILLYISQHPSASTSWKNIPCLRLILQESLNCKQWGMTICFSTVESKCCTYRHRACILRAISLHFLRCDMFVWLDWGDWKELLFFLICDKIAQYLSNWWHCSRITW